MLTTTFVVSYRTPDIENLQEKEVSAETESDARATLLGFVPDADIVLVMGPFSEGQFSPEVDPKSVREAEETPFFIGVDEAIVDSGGISVITIGNVPGGAGTVEIDLTGLREDPAIAAINSWTRLLSRAHALDDEQRRAVRTCTTCGGVNSIDCAECFGIGKQATYYAINGEAGVVTNITSYNDGGISVNMGGAGFSLDPLYADRVKVGDSIRLFGKGFGHRIQGVAVNGEILWLMTDEEVQAEHEEWCRKYEAEKLDEYEKNKEKWLAQIAELPTLLRARMERFMTENETFLKDSGVYELYCCTEAVKLHAYLKGEAEKDPYFYKRIRKIRLRIVKKILETFRELRHEQQVDLAGIDNGHSGNTFSGACMLAARVLCGLEV